MTTVTISARDPSQGFLGDSFWRDVLDTVQHPTIISGQVGSDFFNPDAGKAPLVILNANDPSLVVTLSGGNMSYTTSGYGGYFYTVEVQRSGLDATLTDFGGIGVFGLNGTYQAHFTLGNDLQNGGDGPDTLEGDLGADTLLGGGGDDILSGGDGQDVLRGEDGDDSISGGADFDDLNGNKGADTIHGGAGDDWVSGGQDDDIVYGDDGHDLVYGNLGDDTVYGGAGDDWIRGGQGDDVVDGGAGNDLIWGDRGNDTLTGGAGADQFHTFAGAGVDKITDFNGAEGDRVVIDDHADYTVTAAGSDTVITLKATSDTVVLQGVALAGFHADWVIQA